jgi:hypothetical protein
VRSYAWVGIVLIVLGVLGLVVQNVHFTEEKKVVDIGPLQVNSTEQHNLPIPTIAGVGAILAGLGIVFAARRAA